HFGQQTDLKRLSC
ncbi:hypothetical protein VCHC50A2_3390B, partial [Vibrio cholerae HC-50A2]